MKPFCASSDPLAGVIENGKPSSFIARDSVALLGSAPRKKTWVSIDMAEKFRSGRTTDHEPPIDRVENK